jgi:hypothetical protein
LAELMRRVRERAAKASSLLRSEFAKKIGRAPAAIRPAAANNPVSVAKKGAAAAPFFVHGLHGTRE